jgi:hypothetical protein
MVGRPTMKTKAYARYSFLSSILWVVVITHAFACDPQPLKDNDDSFVEAVAKRFARSGIRDVDPVTHTPDGGTLYVLLGSNVRLVIRDDGGYPTEIGTVLSEPSSKGDRAPQGELIGFALTRIGGGRENAVTNAINDSLSSHNISDTWTERSGDAVAVITRSSDGLVAKVGLCR